MAKKSTPKPSAAPSLDTVLDDVAITALNKLVKEKVGKAARANLGAGTHPVDVTIRVVGTLDVAPDTSRVPTVSIPLKEVLALFIARAGGTREGSVALLRSCMHDALRLGPTGVGAIEGVVEVDAAYVAMVAELTASLQKTPVRGDVTANLAVTLVVPA